LKWDKLERSRAGIMTEDRPNRGKGFKMVKVVGDRRDCFQSI